MRARRLVVGLLAVVGALALPAAAGAATVGVSGGALHFEAASGEANWVFVYIDDDGLYVQDSADTIIPGTGCTAIEWWLVKCTDSASPTGLPRDLRIDLGDSNDFLVVSDEARDLDDVPSDGPEATDYDYIEVDGGAGDDAISVPVNDVNGEHLTGGSGDDGLHFTDHTRFGTPGGTSRYVRPPVSTATHYASGGAGDDEVSSAARNGTGEFYGDAGNDHLAGRGFLSGGAGDDELDTIDKPPFGDELDCGPGDDVAGVDREDETTDCEDVTALDRAQRGYLGLLPLP